MKFILILSNRDGGLDEDRVLKGAFIAKGYEASIRDWKAKDILSIAAGADAAIIRTTWDYTDHLEHYLKTLTLISKKTTLINSMKTVEWNHNKKYLLELSQKGIRIIKSTFFENHRPNEIKEYMDDSPAKDFIIKPAVGAGGRRIVRFSKSDIDNTRVSESFTNGFGAIIQPFDPDIQAHGEWALLYFGGKLVYSVHKRPTQGEYKVQRQYGGTEKVASPPKAVARLAQQSLKAMPELPLFARIDVLASPSEPKLVELEAIEPRLFFDTFPGFAELFVEEIRVTLN